MASMSSGSDVGISPVLLQAITHLSGTNASRQRAGAVSGEHHVIIQDGKKKYIKVEAPAHFIQGMGDQIIVPQHSLGTFTHAHGGAGENVVYIQSTEQTVEEQVETVETETVVQEEPEPIHHQPVIWQTASGITTVAGEAASGSNTNSQDSVSNNAIATTNPGDVNMGSVLSALATQYKLQSASASGGVSVTYTNNGHVIKREIDNNEGEDSGDDLVYSTQQVPSASPPATSTLKEVVMPVSMVPISSKHGSVIMKRVPSSLDSKDRVSMPTMSFLPASSSNYGGNNGGGVIYSTQRVPSPSTKEIVVAASNANELTESPNHTFTVMSGSPTSYVIETPVKKQRIELADNTNTPVAPTTMPGGMAPLIIHKIGDNTFIDANTGQAIEIQGLQGAGGALGLDTGTIVVRTIGPDGQLIVQQEEHKPCPVCGDKISGYHYGIYSCESCKGFFKRTVQNKKAFICHRKGECDVSLSSRKKCPACRFKRCLVAGMRLEAIRSDRHRGGRSSYDGCSPHGRTSSSPRPPKPITPRSYSSPHVVKNVVNQVMSQPSLVTPTTPQILEDLIAIESLMSEDEGEQPCCAGKLQPGDEDIFGSVLHFADHCLYKIVRWARNLPDFASVSTDDQILLLQNCWGELLCLCCCWHSIHCENELKLCYGRIFSMEHAYVADMRDITQRMIDFASQMRRLEIDAHEFVAMKVLMLLTPDVKNLKDGSVIRKQQEKVTDALMIYTTTHYQDKPNKFCELLTRLAEMSRTCLQGKEVLTQRQSQGDIPQYSLLSELLKGDIVVQSSG